MVSKTKSGSPSKHHELSLNTKADLHLARKLWHFGTGAIFMYFYFEMGISAQEMSTGLLGLAIGYLLLDIVRLNNQRFNNFWTRTFKVFFRESEKNSISGLPYYALGASIALYLFPEKIAILGIIYLMVGDPISSIVGTQYGRTPLMNAKSFEGALGGYLACVAATLIYGLIYNAAGEQLIVFAFIGGVFGAISELLSGKIDDNLTIPVASGAGLLLLNKFIPIFS